MVFASSSFYSPPLPFFFQLLQIWVFFVFAFASCVSAIQPGGFARAKFAPIPAPSSRLEVEQVFP